jgi:hypothetical protein
MQKDKRTFQIGLTLVTITISLSCLFAQPAQAIIRDQAVVGRLEEQRNTLLIKENRLLRDYDEIQRQLREFQKDNSDGRAIDQLCRQADLKYEDLQSVRSNLRQLETLLM